MAMITIPADELKRMDRRDREQMDLIRVQAIAIREYQKVIDLVTETLRGLNQKKTPPSEPTPGPGPGSPISIDRIIS